MARVCLRIDRFLVLGIAFLKSKVAALLLLDLKQRILPTEIFIDLIPSNYGVFSAHMHDVNFSVGRKQGLALLIIL